MDKKDLPEPERTGQTWWFALTKEAKYEAVLPYLKLGASNAVIAALLELVSPNAVARFRHIWNQRTHPERYNADGTPKEIKAKKKEVKKKKKAKKKKPSAKAQELAQPPPTLEEPATNVVPLSSARPTGDKEPQKSFEVKPEPRAEHTPGTSPALKRVPGLSTKNEPSSAFPKTRSETKNPEDLTAEELRAIQSMYKDD